MKPRLPEVIYRAPTFEAHKNHIVAIFPIGGPNQTFGVRFESPEQMLEFFSKLMEKAALVWPDNAWIKEYLEE